MAFYENGKRIGPAWEFKIGGGVVVGKVNVEGDLTGDDFVYAYPDFTTLLVGTFAKGVMVAAKQTLLTDVRFDRISKIPFLLFDKKVLEVSKQVFTFNEPTR